MTHGDRLRNMTDKEFAEMIADNMPCSRSCPCYEDCCAASGYECKKNIEHWLHQEDDGRNG